MMGVPNCPRIAHWQSESHPRQPAGSNVRMRESPNTRPDAQPTNRTSEQPTDDRRPTTAPKRSTPPTRTTFPADFLAPCHPPKRRSRPRPGSPPCIELPTFCISHQPSNTAPQTSAFPHRASHRTYLTGPPCIALPRPAALMPPHIKPPPQHRYGTFREEPPPIHRQTATAEPPEA